MDLEKSEIALALSTKEERAMLRDDQPPSSPPSNPYATLPAGGGHEDGHTLCSRASVRIATCHLVSASLCQDRHHRKLAVGSIICGCTPIGIVSLINSVKAREACRSNPEKSEQYSRKAKKYGILSIVVFVIFLIMLPVLVVLGSYLLTLID